MTNREIEFKYDASEISAYQFMNFCKDKKDFIKQVHVTGTDKFYSSVFNPNSFFRVRNDGTNVELTFKSKIRADNVYRVEYNLKLFEEGCVHEMIEESTGFVYNNQIYKVSDVYIFKTYVAAYYIVYNRDYREVGRFVELELNVDFPSYDPDDSIKILELIERSFKEMGIKKSNRLSKSLFEMYRVENK